MRKWVVGIAVLLTVSRIHAQTATAKPAGLMRVENEYKLYVPDTLADAVWEWLVSEFGPQGSAMRSIDSGFASKVATDRMVDQYFDNDRWQLLHSGNGVRLRSRQVLSDTTDRKHGRRLMQIKINRVDDNALNRGEYKFKTDTLISDSASIDPRERHPFLGLVAPFHRDSILRVLRLYGVDGDSLHPTLLLDQMRRRIYLYRDTIAFATLSLDEITARFGDKQHYSHELELELNEIGYTNDDPTGRAEMEHISALIKERVVRQWPRLKQDQRPKYLKAWEAMMLPWDCATQEVQQARKQRIRGWSIGGGAVTVLIIALAARRRRNRRKIGAP